MHIVSDYELIDQSVSPASQDDSTLFRDKGHEGLKIWSSKSKRKSIPSLNSIDATSKRLDDSAPSADSKPFKLMAAATNLMNQWMASKSMSEDPLSHLPEDRVKKDPDGGLDETKRSHTFIKPIFRMYRPRHPLQTVANKEAYLKNSVSKDKFVDLKKHRHLWWPDAVGNTLCITQGLYEIHLKSVHRFRQYLLKTSSRYRSRLESTFGVEAVQPDVSLENSEPCSYCGKVWDPNLVSAFEMISVDIPRTLPRLGVIYRLPGRELDLVLEKKGSFDLDAAEADEEEQPEASSPKDEICDQIAAAECPSETCHKEVLHGRSEQQSEAPLSQNNSDTFQFPPITSDSDLSDDEPDGLTCAAEDATTQINHDAETLYQRLRQILEVFVTLRPDIGYVQGMPYIASMVILFVQDDYLAFVCFANLILKTDLLFSLYTFDEPKINAIYQTFDHLLTRKCPEIAHFIEMIQIPSAQFLTDWMFTLFTRSVPFSLLCEIWDAFILKGTPVLYQMSLSLIYYLYSQIQFDDSCGKDPRDQFVDLISTSSTKHYEPIDTASFLHKAESFEVSGHKVEKLQRRFLSRQLDSADRDSHAVKGEKGTISLSDEDQVPPIDNPVQGPAPNQLPLIQEKPLVSDPVSSHSGDSPDGSKRFGRISSLLHKFQQQAVKQMTHPAASS